VLLFCVPPFTPKPLAYRRYVDSSFGWDPTSKRGELFDSASRFVLVRQIGPPKSVESQPLIAYTMFRFDREARENVVYWYVSLIFDGS
jgi:N-alpha-acetyltransferase 40